MFKFSKRSFTKAGPKNRVLRILGLWEPAEGMSGGKSCRGFSAQILFFAQNGDVPVQVDGDVRIYVFDDQGTEDERAMPLHEFNYPPETWNAFLFDGSLGATYSVFVPYTRPGIHEAKCSLRIRYMPKDGSGIPAYSEMVNVVLPGTKKIRDDEDRSGLIPNLGSRGSADQTSTAVANRSKSQARNIVESLPSPHEIQEQMRAKGPRAVELNAEERRRIMEEATARLKSNGDSRVAHAGYDVRESGPGPKVRSSEAPRSRAVTDDDGDEFSDDAADSSKPARPFRRSRMTEDQDFPDE
jgi:hypothetical protein